METLNTIYTLSSYPEFDNQKGSNYSSEFLNIFATKVSIGLGCGSSDRVNVLHKDKLFFVVSENNPLDYLGMEVFNSEGDSIGEIFLQGSEALENAFFGNSQEVFDLTTVDQAQVLSNFIEF